MPTVVGWVFVCGAIVSVFFVLIFPKFLNFPQFLLDSRNFLSNCATFSVVRSDALS